MPTRWNSKYLMIAGVVRLSREIEATLLRIKEEESVRSRRKVACQSTPGKDFDRGQSPGSEGYDQDFEASVHLHRASGIKQATYLNPAAKHHELFNDRVTRDGYNELLKTHAESLIVQKLLDLIKIKGLPIDPQDDAGNSSYDE
ncbi:hypothetical protein BGZ67_004351 [Mortierella alpina]|nr:hypothetical protein BGZ67_004351 [Mortierella alpina]